MLVSSCRSEEELEVHPVHTLLSLWQLTFLFLSALPMILIIVQKPFSHLVPIPLMNLQYVFTWLMHPDFHPVWPWKPLRFFFFFNQFGGTALISSFASLFLVSVLIFNYLKVSLSFRHFIYCLVFSCQENGWKTVKKNFCFYCAIKVPKEPSHKAQIQQSKKIAKFLQKNMSSRRCPRTQSKTTPLAKITKINGAGRCSGS